MAFAGLIFIGLLFGVILGGGVVAFIVVRAGGPLKESLFGDDARKPAFKGAPGGPEVPPEADTRQKALLEALTTAEYPRFRYEWDVPSGRVVRDPRLLVQLGYAAGDSGGALSHDGRVRRPDRPRGFS